MTASLNLGKLLRSNEDVSKQCISVKRLIKTLSGKVTEIAENSEEHYSQVRSHLFFS